jgi:hypothetical protein
MSGKAASESNVRNAWMPSVLFFQAAIAVASAPTVAHANATRATVMGTVE